MYLHRFGATTAMLRDATDFLPLTHVVYHVLLSLSVAVSAGLAAA